MDTNFSMKPIFLSFFRKSFWIISIILFFLVFLIQILIGSVYDLFNGIRMSAIHLKRKIFPSTTALPKRKVRKPKSKSFNMPSVPSLPALPKLPKVKLKRKWFMPAVSAALIISFFSINYSNITGFFADPPPPKKEELYLIKEATTYIKEKAPFEAGVKKLAAKLEIPPEWLMAVMYMESRFNPAVANHRGSGAVGLIQFMVPTVREMNMRMNKKLYMQDIQNMSGVEQLELVENYLQTVRKRRGEFNSLRDLYLAILYPKAINRDLTYKLFSKPSKRYTQNSGLDMNKDGIVSVWDIDVRMKKMFPTAYHTKKPGSL